MKIACIDKTAADRIALQHKIESSYESSRNILGHINLAQIYPVSKDELILSSSPEVIAVGPNFTIEEAYSVCREIKTAFPETPLLLFLNSNLYSLRSLRRFRPVCTETFTVDENPTRLVHTLTVLDTDSLKNKSGKLIVVSGVKGGVGTTTLVSGLLHSAEASGKSAIAIDLSQNGALIQYMAAPRWQSPDYAALLTENLTPDETLVKRCITVAPNGINLLLPPAGGSDIREAWLREPQKFEISLSVVEILKDLYDLVIVDCANAEGVLFFALSARANTRLLVSSNDPASVHLLNSQLSLLAEIPGDSQIQIALNQIDPSGLTREDILDFLYINEHFQKSMVALPTIAYDNKGRNWIGTGNTFYTESNTATQKTLEQTLNLLSLTREELEKKLKHPESIFTALKKIPKTQNKKRQRLQAKILALPNIERALPEPIVSSLPNNDFASQNGNGKSHVHFLNNSSPDRARVFQSSEILRTENKIDQLEETRSAIAVKDNSFAGATMDCSLYYQSPQLIINGKE
jgi:cellulose biosynthesis protein BcsQ